MEIDERIFGAQLASAYLLRLMRSGWDARRRVIEGARELQGMSDLELRDLGIGRSEIAYAVAQAEDQVQSSL
jgi:uncharacterized protein YjiS (DUF1127 family)